MIESLFVVNAATMSYRGARILINRQDIANMAKNPPLSHENPFLQFLTLLGFSLPTHRCDERDRHRGQALQGQIRHQEHQPEPAESFSPGSVP